MKIWKPEPNRWVVIGDDGALYDATIAPNGAKSIQCTGLAGSPQLGAVWREVERYETSLGPTEVSLGRKVRGARIDAGVSLRELSIRTGISAVRLGELERGVIDRLGPEEMLRLHTELPELATLPCGGDRG